MSSHHRTLPPAAWLAFGLLMLAALSLCYLVEENQVPRLSLAAWFLIWMLWIPIQGLVSRVVERHPIDRPSWRRSVPLYLLSSVFLLAGLLILRVLLDQLFNLLNGSEFQGFRPRAFLIQSVVYDAFAGCGFVALAHASIYSRQLNGRQIREAKLQARLAEIQLGFLRAQLQPHFLLNSLNLISAQIYDDVERADAMISDLGALLRATLESSEQQEIALAEELQLLDLYLDIARTRFEDSLSVESHVDPKTLDALVPSLLLQPLVENAIRHGMSTGRRPTLVRIAVHRDPYSVLITVADNGPGFPQPFAPGDETAGIGLANTRQRLEQLYAEDHRLSITNLPEGGARIEIELPYRTAGSLLHLRNMEDGSDDSHLDRRRRAASA